MREKVGGPGTYRVGDHKSLKENDFSLMFLLFIRSFIRTTLKWPKISSFLLYLQHIA